MKNKIFAILSAIGALTVASLLMGAVEITSDISHLKDSPPSQTTKTVSATGTPERISSNRNNSYFRKAMIIGRKDPRTANTGTVWIGPNSTDNSQAIEIAPDDIFVLEAPVGAKDALYYWYVDVATTGDGVTVIFW